MSNGILERDRVVFAQDVDVAEAILKFSAEEYTYQAALAVNARILRTSLIDFLSS